MKSFSEWRGQALGHKIDLDNQSYDCVDVPKSWAEYLVGKPWQQSFGWGNAKDLYYNVPTTYWEKLPRGTKPQPGDVVCMDGSIGGGYGHTGVVDSVNGGNMTILQQNTFSQQAVYTGIYNWNASYIQGYLRPKVAFGEPGPVASNQRVAAFAVFYRQAPNSSAPSIKLLEAGLTYDFKGFIRGEAVDGNNIWFIGAYTGGYAWSGAFTDMSTNGLPDLTPAAALSPSQRQVGPDAMNYRRTPQVAPDNVMSVLSPGDVYDFDGWVHGQSVDGNDIWFRGKEHQGYVHSSGMTNASTSGLNEIVAQAQTPVTAEQPAYSFTADLPCVTQVSPAANGNFEHGNFPAKPLKAVLHDFGTKGTDTFTSTLNQFKAKSEVSAHFVVAQKNIVQVVKLSDRAYHAGPNGNDYIGIEIDPLMDKDTIESVRTLLTQLKDYYGYKLELIEHNQIMPTACGDDVNLADFNIDWTPVPVTVTPTPVPTPLPSPVPTPVPTPVPGTPANPAPAPEYVKLARAVVLRAARTFAQAFGAAFTAGYATSTDAIAIKALIVASLAAGISAVWNVIVPPAEAKTIPPE